MKLLLALILISAIQARAEAPLDLIRVVNPAAMTYSESMQSLALVNTFYQRNLGISFRLAVEYQYADDDSISLSLTAFESTQSFLAFQKRFKADGLLCRADRITLAMLPPLAEGKALYNAGMAWIGRVGIRPALAIAFCGHSYTRCQIPIAHELGHALGAQHNDSAPNIMHQDAQPFGELALVMLPRTKTQIRRHLKAVRLWSLYKR